MYQSGESVGQRRALTYVNSGKTGVSTMSTAALALGLRVNTWRQGATMTRIGITGADEYRTALACVTRRGGRRTACAAAMLRCYKSREGAAAGVGATQIRIFREIAFPMVWKGILVGVPFPFMKSLQGASAKLLLTLRSWKMMPFSIFTACISGSQKGSGSCKPFCHQPDSRHQSRRIVWIMSWIRARISY